MTLTIDRPKLSPADIQIHKKSVQCACTPNRPHSSFPIRSTPVDSRTGPRTATLAGRCPKEASFVLTKLETNGTAEKWAEKTRRKTAAAWFVRELAAA